MLGASRSHRLFSVAAVITPGSSASQQISVLCLFQGPGSVGRAEPLSSLKTASGFGACLCVRLFRKSRSSSVYGALEKSIP